MALTTIDPSIPLSTVICFDISRSDQSVLRDDLRLSCAKSDNIMTIFSPLSNDRRLSLHKADGSEDFTHIRVLAVYWVDSAS